MNQPVSSMSVLFVISNFPDFETARTASEILIERRLVACANILDGCTSMFLWKEKVEIASEIPVYYKTTLAQYAEFEAALLELHPYDVPEIIAFPVELGLQAYLQWVTSEAQSAHKIPNAPSSDSQH